MNPRRAIRRLLRRTTWWRSREAAYKQGFRDGYTDGWDSCVGEALPMFEETYNAQGDKCVAGLHIHPADALRKWNGVHSPSNFATDKEKQDERQ